MVDGEQEKLNNVFVQNTLSNGCAVPQAELITSLDGFANDLP